MSKINLEILKEHQQYVADSQACIQELKKKFSTESKDLNYTPESLKLIDKIIKENIKKNENDSWPPKNPEISQEEKWLIIRLAYYVAEVFIQNTNAFWIIDEDNRSRFYGESVLLVPNKKQHYNPLRIVLASAKNHKSLYDNYIFWTRNIT